jgi:CDP-diacylglycerol---glycerol-3-phosphate 3-phosphatidyltransferase
MAKLDTTRKSIGSGIAGPIVKMIAHTPLTPNAITTIGFIITLGAAALIFTNHLLAAGIVVLVAGIFDMLDGALARLTNKTTRFGAIYDSTLDRVSEAVLLVGVLAVYVRGGEFAECMVVAAALVGSLLVSYTRARMEGLGIECKAGLFTRPERVVTLVAGLIFSHFNPVLLIAVAIITFFSWYTVVQRMVYAWNKLKE